MTSQEAELAVRTELGQSMTPSFIIDATVLGVSQNPDQFTSQAGNVGEYARRLIAERQVDQAIQAAPVAASQAAAPAAAVAPAQAMPMLPYDPSVPPGPSREESEVMDVDPERLTDDKRFRPLGDTLFSGAPAGHKFSHLRIDHTLSGFSAGSEEEKAIKLIYRQLMYTSKRGPCKEIPASHNGLAEFYRGPFFSGREHDHEPPATTGAHSEVLVYGATQLSKTPEACSTAWLAFFCDGSLPIIGVRNKGGANQGSADMKKGINSFNEIVEQIFRFEVRRGKGDPGGLQLKEADYVKFQLNPRCASNQDYTEFDHNSRKLARPQVFIMCMNPRQVKDLLAERPDAKRASAGATAGLFSIMKGKTVHPYPPKCHKPHELFDNGANRPVARIYLILDEDDLNRSNRAGAGEKLQFDAPSDVKKKLNDALNDLVKAGATAAARAAAAVGMDLQPSDPLLSSVAADDDDDDTSTLAGSDDEDVEREEGGRNHNEIDAFFTELKASGIRSDVRGVVALTATPSACGQDLTAGSQVMHQVCMMQHPSNYVGYPFTAAPYAERTVKHEAVPDRKQIHAIAKTALYQGVLKAYDWWDTLNDAPMPPFKTRTDGAITVMKRHLDDVVQGGEMSSRDIYNIVDHAQRISSWRGDKVLESDGVGIALMLQSMSEHGASVEPERRALVFSNYTKTLDQKMRLARHILNGDLYLETGTKLAPKCYVDVFVIIFDHKHLRILWRGPQPAAADAEVSTPAEHSEMEVLHAIRDASPELYDGCWAADKRSGSEPCVVTEGGIKCFDSKFININHAYTALLLYAHRRRAGGRHFKLKTLAETGDLGMRGVAYKPHGMVQDAAKGKWIVSPHQGYLTDMFFMFDAVKNRQITTHGEQVLQAIGRLCTLVNDADLAKMAQTPPRLWTSHSCYGVISIFARATAQWAEVMSSKVDGESMVEAVVRNIKAQPQPFAALNMIYTRPTTDPRWAKKELFLRPDRLFSAAKAIGEGCRCEASMPQAHGTFGIRQDLDEEKRKRTADAVSEAGVRQAVAAAMEGEMSDAEDGAELPPAIRRKLKTIATAAEALEKWMQAVALAFKSGTANDEAGSSTAGAGLGVTRVVARDYMSRIRRARKDATIKDLDDVHKSREELAAKLIRSANFSRAAGRSLEPDDMLRNNAAALATSLHKALQLVPTDRFAAAA